MAISLFPSAAARGLLFLVLIPTLRVAGAISDTQQAPGPPRSPARFDDLAARAATARDQQNLPLAIQLYSQAEQLKPDWQEGWWYLGILQYSANQYPGAIDAFSHLLQLVPTAVPAMALRGLCEFETGGYDALSATLSRLSLTEPLTSRATSRSSATTWHCCCPTPADSRKRSTSTASSLNTRQTHPI